MRGGPMAARGGAVDGGINGRASGGVRRAAGRITRRLKRQAAGVSGVILCLPVRGDPGAIVREAMRPHGVLGQQQRQRQHDTQNGNQKPVHDGVQYKTRRAVKRMRSHEIALTPASGASYDDPS